MTWRSITDRLKHSRLVMRLADRLGRGRGALRILDHMQARPPAPKRPDLQDWAGRALSALWIGHATVLLRIDGLTILTDPVFSRRVGLGLGLITLGPHRLIAPALELHRLPPLDVIVISHAHFDHLDRPTLRRLPKDAAVICPKNTADLIRDLGFARVHELDWGQGLEMAGIKFTSRQVAHWGARTFFDKHRGYAAFLIESSRHRVLYAPDSAYHDYFRDIANVDLAIFGIAAYDPYIQAHASPEQVWAMANQVHAAHVFPIHHSTFRLSHEPMSEPLQRLLAAAGNDAERIVVHEVGGQWLWSPLPCTQGRGIG